MNISLSKIRRKFKAIVGKKVILKIKWSLRLKRKDKQILQIKQRNPCIASIDQILSEILMRFLKHNINSY